MKTMRLLIAIATHTRSNSPRGKIFPRKLQEICQATTQCDVELLILYAVLNQNSDGYHTQLFTKDSVETISTSISAFETTINNLLVPALLPTLALYLDGNLGNPGDYNFSELAKQHAQQIAYNQLVVFSETPQILEKARTQAIAPSCYAEDAITTKDLLTHIKQLVIDAVPDFNQTTLPSTAHSSIDRNLFLENTSPAYPTSSSTEAVAKQNTPFLFRLFSCCQPRKQVLPDETVAALNCPNPLMMVNSFNKSSTGPSA